MNYDERIEELENKIGALQIQITLISSNIKGIFALTEELSDNFDRLWRMFNAVYEPA